MSTQIEHLERRVELLDTELTAVRMELRALKHPAHPPAPAAAAPPPSAAPPVPHLGALTPPHGVKEQRRAAAAPAPARVMAWVGGSALLVALILLLALAVSRGWIGEEARTAMAGLASLLLVAGGARAYERRGRTEAAVAAAAAGVAGGFATLAVATEVYGLIPAAAGLPLGLAWGATAAILALRWRSTTLAVLGIAGGLLSPVLAGADVEATQTIALLAIGYAGAAAVSVALGWSWLGLLAFLLVTPQWAWYAAESGSLLAVVVFGAIGAVAVARGSGASAHLLLALNATALAAGGYGLLWEPTTSLDGKLWLVAVAAVHVAAGVTGLRRDRQLAVTALGAGVVVGDIALADLVSGLVLPLAWAASAVVFALLARYERVAAVGLGGHLALAIGHVLTQEAPFEALGGGGSAAGIMAATAIAASCLASARLSETRLRDLLDAAGLLAVAYTTALAFDGAALAVAWAAEAAALGSLTRMVRVNAPRAGKAATVGVAEGGAIAFLIGAVTATLAVPASPLGLALGIDDLGGATLALLAIAVAAPQALGRPAGLPVGGVALLYLASLTVVTLIDGQAGQLTLSALWGTTALAALLAGILRDHATLRAAGLTLLAIATAKVFVVDLASLDSLTRVGSFLVLGTVLLAGAFAWQRARPS